MTEAASRVRRYARLDPRAKIKSPLLVLVAKSDVWEALVDAELVTEPHSASASVASVQSVDVARVEQVSAKVRELLSELTPEFVTAAEDACNVVLYIPVSAFGCSPQPMRGKGYLGIRPKDVSPRWVTVPLLYAFAKWSTGLLFQPSTPNR